MTDTRPPRGGILLHGTAALLALLLQFDIPACAEEEGEAMRYRLEEEYARKAIPGHDTLGLPSRLHLDTPDNESDLEREILIAMLDSPATFEFPSADELHSHIHIRKNIVRAARNTQLDFHTREAERPADYWTYNEDTGFTILPGVSLVEALRKATQPAPGEPSYAFSCYRASEYVILLGIAEELQHCNPALYARLQMQWQTKAIMSGRFHDVFLRELGSMEQPLPMRHYVPGDRVWFRNPDPVSSDLSGYEGSWVIYLGGGLFSNFWNRDRPYTFEQKCVEIYQWRNGITSLTSGGLDMDETKVADLVAQTIQDRNELARILDLMFRLRDPQGIYAQGGCIDATRESPRLVHAASATISL